MFYCPNGHSNYFPQQPKQVPPSNPANLEVALRQKDVEIAKLRDSHDRLVERQKDLIEPASLIKAITQIDPPARLPNETQNAYSKKVRVFDQTISRAKKIILKTERAEE